MSFEATIQVLTRAWLGRWHTTPLNSFPPHAHLEALFKSAVLALIPVVLINRTIPISTTRVGEVTPDAPFEETLATFASKLTIMLSTTLIMTYYTLDML